MGGGPSQEIIPLHGSILQAETCQILSLAENPRWSPSVAIFVGHVGYQRYGISIDILIARVFTMQGLMALLVM